LTERDLTLLRSWARRWALLLPATRDFYTRHVQAEHETARVVLWRVLEGKRPEDWQVRRLESLWEQETGVQPIGVPIAPFLP
jgi:hypothetical protein